MTKVIKIAKGSYSTLVCDKHKGNPKKLWNELHKVTGNSKYVQDTQCDIDPDGLNDYFVTVGQDISDSFVNTPLMWKNPKCMYEFKFHDFVVDDVLKLLQQLSNDSNLDILDIDCKLLKLVAPYLAK